MPLSKVKNRERMRKVRGVQPVCNLIIHNPPELVQPKLRAVGLNLKGNKVIGCSKPYIKPQFREDIDADGNPMPEYT